MGHKEFRIRIVNQDEYKEWCKQQIKEKGLRWAIKEELDEIVPLCSGLGYLQFSEITERCVRILDLIDAFGERFGIYRIEKEEHT